MIVLVILALAPALLTLLFWGTYAVVVSLSPPPPTSPARTWEEAPQGFVPVSLLAHEEVVLDLPTFPTPLHDVFSSRCPSCGLAPGLDCTCGETVFADLSRALSFSPMVLSVRVLSEAVRHERGWRTSHYSPQALLLTSDCPLCTTPGEASPTLVLLQLGERLFPACKACAGRRPTRPLTAPDLPTELLSWPEGRRVRHRILPRLRVRPPRTSTPQPSDLRAPLALHHYTPEAPLPSPQAVLLPASVSE